MSVLSPELSRIDSELDALAVGLDLERVGSELRLAPRAGLSQIDAALSALGAGAQPEPGRRRVEPRAAAERSPDARPEPTSASPEPSSPELAAIAGRAADHEQAVAARAKRSVSEPPQAASEAEPVSVSEPPQAASEAEPVAPEPSSPEPAAITGRPVAHATSSAPDAEPAPAAGDQASARVGSSRASSRRAASEAGPVASEAGRVEAEAGPVASEAGRVASEAGRVASEAGPVEAEAGRVASEAGRVEADVRSSDAAGEPSRTEVDPKADELLDPFDDPAADEPDETVIVEEEVGGLDLDVLFDGMLEEALSAPLDEGKLLGGRRRPPITEIPPSLEEQLESDSDDEPILDFFDEDGAIEIDEAEAFDAVDALDSPSARPPADDDDEEGGSGGGAHEKKGFLKKIFG